MIDKAKLRIMAMDKIMKDKPMFADKLAAKKSAGDMEGQMGDEGMVSMAVTPEEKAMILTMREKEDAEDAQDGGADEAAEGDIA